MSPRPEYPHTHTHHCSSTTSNPAHYSTPPPLSNIVLLQPPHAWPKGAAQGGCPLLKRPCACMCFGVCIFPQTPPLRFLTTRELQARQGRKNPHQKKTEEVISIYFLYLSLVRFFFPASSVAKHCLSQYTFASH